MSVTYKDSGVNIEAGAEAVNKIKSKVQATHSPLVLNNLGGFGGAFDIGTLSKHYKHPILVQSTDGVGTKVMIAKKMKKYEGLGIDVVSNNVNDILCLGARPITFLDYIGCSKLKPDEIESVVNSMAEACEETGVSLVGGEMAEMPGVYTDGEIDVIGCVTGVVEKDKIITGKNIKPGDLVFGFGSSGLHTNGYSLARKVLFEIGGYDVWDKFPEMEKNLGETLLEPHINYTNPILEILDRGVEIKGLSHITGGGFIENIPRILPKGCGVEIQRYSFPVPKIFELIQKVGEVEDREMYRTFNMGIGMIMIIAESEKNKAIEIIQTHPSFTLYEIGKVVEDNQGAVNVV